MQKKEELPLVPCVTTKITAQKCETCHVVMPWYRSYMKEGKVSHYYHCPNCHGVRVVENGNILSSL